MKLTYDRGYEDYADTTHWLPRLAYLQSFADALRTDTASAMPEQEVLDTMEQLEELIRYYCVEQDYKSLEQVMRQFDVLLNQCRSRGISGVEFTYLEMVFLRVNALLYRAHGQNRKAAEEYDRCIVTAERCFGLLQDATHLDEEQILYVGWNCVECFRETAETNDAILNGEGALRILRTMIPMLEWLEDYYLSVPGICDQASELYLTIAGVLSPYQDFLKEGESCYEKAIELLNGLDRRGGSDFYRARAIWLHCIYGLVEFTQRGNLSVMMTCEEEVEEYLTERCHAEKRDTAIVRGAKGLILLQKAVAFQQNGKQPQAIDLAEKGCGLLEETLEILEADYKPRHDSYRSVVYRIAARIYSSYVGAMDSLGLMYYQNEQFDLAEQTYLKTLKLMTDSDGYSIGESASSLIRAEINQYLALIATDKGDGYQADFYATQAADLAVELGQRNSHAGAWEIAVVSCSLVAEVCLAMKNKTKAQTYADKGLQACDSLAAIMPQNSKLVLRDTLKKFKKKASRWFF